MTLRGLEAELGRSRTLLTRILSDSGMTTPPTGRRAVEIDPVWLRDEYWTFGRPLPDLARELGMTPTNLGRRMKQMGIPVRGRGTASHRTPSSNLSARQLPQPLRSALAVPNAEARLERFIALADHPTLAAAARASGTSGAVVSVQLKKLELAVGEILLERHAKGPGDPHRLTAAGVCLASQYVEWRRSQVNAPIV